MFGVKKKKIRSMSSPQQQSVGYKGPVVDISETPAGHTTTTTSERRASLQQLERVKRSSDASAQLPSRMSTSSGAYQRGSIIIPPSSDSVVQSGNPPVVSLPKPVHEALEIDISVSHGVAYVNRTSSNLWIKDASTTVGKDVVNANYVIAGDKNICRGFELNIVIPKNV